MIDAIWKGGGPMARTVRAGLVPASIAFGAAVRARRALYRWGVFSKTRLPIAVVSVGNLTVGGTGKTPTALWLAEKLVDRGWRVAILTRGYGGTDPGPTVVDPDARDPSRRWGDEACLLARRSRSPVVVARHRAEGGWLAHRELQTEVVVLDDGFQHLALERDFDLVLLGEALPERPLLLPAGPFRELPNALERADAVLLTKRGSGADRPAGARPDLPTFRGRLEAGSLVAAGPEPSAEIPLETLAGARVLAVSGIADPGSFRDSVQKLRANIVDYLEFPDHHAYTSEDWKRILVRARDLDLVITTEKDLVKLERYSPASDELLAIRVSMSIDGGDELLEAIEARVEKISGHRQPARS